GRAADGRSLRAGATEHWRERADRNRQATARTHRGACRGGRPKCAARRCGGLDLVPALAADEGRAGFPSEPSWRRRSTTRETREKFRATGKYGQAADAAGKGVGLLFALCGRDIADSTMSVGGGQ